MDVDTSAGGSSCVARAAEEDDQWPAGGVGAAKRRSRLGHHLMHLVHGRDGAGTVPEPGFGKAGAAATAGAAAGLFHTAPGAADTRWLERVQWSASDCTFGNNTVQTRWAPP